jgi:hypothetical protein
MSRSPSRSISDHVAETRRRIEQVPVGEQRTLLEIKFAASAQTLARQIRDARRK